MAAQRSPGLVKLTAVQSPGSAAGPGTDVIFCPRCGRRNGRAEIFCQVCALPLQQNAGCRYCRTAIPANATFCPACGRRLATG